MISETMFPLAKYTENVFVKILSIGVAELLHTLVGLSIVGTEAQICRQSRNCCT